MQRLARWCHNEITWSESDMIAGLFHFCPHGALVPTLRRLQASEARVGFVVLYEYGFALLL